MSDTNPLSFVPARPASGHPELATLLARISDAYDPVAVILFGSRARGDHGPDSDWDLKVVVRDDAPEALLDPGLGWSVQEGSGVHADVTCARLSELVADLDVANSAAREIARDGVRLVPTIP